MKKISISEPIYIRAQRDIMKLLKEEGYSPGSKVPSERELSSHFGASRMTMRKAVEQLVDRGVLERRGTSGTYLPEKIFVRPLSRDVPFGVSEVAKKFGRLSGSKLLYFEKQPADELTAENLRLEKGDSVISIRRQRTIDKIPVCIELTKIPSKYIPGLSATDIVENASLYDLFSKRYGLEHHMGESKLSVGWLTEEEGTLLNLPPNSAVLDYQSISLLNDGAPFEYLRSINHPRYVNFRIVGSQGNTNEKPRYDVKFTVVDGEQSPI